MMGWRCIYLLSIPRAVHGVEMAESDRVALYAADGAPHAAILLTGHVRTFDLTAPTLDEFLIKANPGYVFSLFCSTYREREAVSISNRQGQTEQRSINEDELYAVYAPFVPRDRFHAELYRPWDVKSGLPFFNPQHARNKTQAGIKKYRNYLRRIRHSSMFELVKRGYEMIERRAGSFDVIVKFRFDLALKAPFVINRRWVERGLVVLPVQIADGGAGIVPKSLATRPCSRDGSASKRPVWVQDHVGYASPDTFRKFSVNVQKYNLRHTTREQAGHGRHPEHYLAASLEEQNVRVNCDETIRYTVKRPSVKGPPRSEPAPSSDLERPEHCYALRYPDLLRELCHGDARRCDLVALRKHYDRRGRREGRRFGCWNVSQARDVVRPKTTVANDSFLSVAGWWQKGR